MKAGHTNTNSQMAALADLKKKRDERTAEEKVIRAPSPGLPNTPTSRIRHVHATLDPSRHHADRARDDIVVSARSAY